ncbi:hypothetical protein [Streptomyces sp. SID13031]|uniref:hypothetical protein n=1 Tax=Streptomyces sp. SID13031 TaxID=2706046 RepID=UPI0013CC3836|nr:hypothetical protein [Streptomyces sp. SID13031]NEA36073.1 hypothetical protein [Streptomyces sp. SID13031]
MSLIDQARSLQTEAHELLERLELERAFPSFDPPQLIGSARSGLMVLRDIDVMFTAPDAAVSAVLAGLADIAQRVELQSVDFRDEREDRRPTPQLTDERFYAVLQHAGWKIELTIWLHAVERPHVADALRVQASKDEEKEAILQLKSSYPGYPEVVGGSDIYPAVLDHGVRSTEELAAYLDN